MSSDSVEYADLASPTESVTPEINQNHVLYFYKEHLNWMILFIVVGFDKSDYQIPPWPEQCQLNTYLNIITYQHYLSLPSRISFLK
ncbi:hypothetical protein [Alteromonas sp. ASW11-130]|uniref:hypothetical protein n=1 Tax=Alteromonas sp. ASW11-130 TaxID=3015775 RepID=UPI002241B399|nr:hypothetical protein [Alteromonas sp. ASW11-130]MCW8090311.1 hypothetical protein [Alteromonas sp. ASW11-130]